MEALNWLTSEERSRSLCALVVGEVLMGEGGEWEWFIIEKDLALLLQMFITA